MKHNLENELTVFVLTVGSPGFGECMRYIQEQDCKFKLEIIDRVAPMNRALQCMLDRCTTPYFVQVDEDMLLNKDAIRTQYINITSSPNKVAIFTSPLYDTHAERLIYGLKIYRHEIVRNYPYNNVEACEFDQIRRFINDGFIDKRILIDDPLKISEDTLGIHGIEWSPLTVYKRYMSLTTKQRMHTEQRPTTAAFWVIDYAEVFLKRFLQSGNQLDLYAFMGILAGKLLSINGNGREKDYRNYNSLPGFEQIENLIQQLSNQPDKKQ
jgi:hypothetical protein